MSIVAFTHTTSYLCYLPEQDPPLSFEQAMGTVNCSRMVETSYFSSLVSSDTCKNKAHPTYSRLPLTNIRTCMFEVDLFGGLLFV